MSKHQKTCKLGQTVDKDEKDEENGIQSKSHQAVQNHHLELIGFDNFNSPPVISVPNMFGRYSLPPFQQTDLNNLKASLEFVLRKERSMLWVWTPEMVGDGGRWVRLRQPLPCLPPASHSSHTDLARPILLRRSHLIFLLYVLKGCVLHFVRHCSCRPGLRQMHFSFLFLFRCASISITYSGTSVCLSVSL